ncbi:MAG: WD40 repeat domain-containing protein, partial [Chloroflexi bacterium]|nr:WD40 repeat domain-containing protein [Chloroflexota bacterium]
HITLWETANWQQPLTQWQAHDGAIHSLAFTNDGTLLTTGQDKQLHQWAIPTGDLIDSSQHSEAITSLSTSPQGTLFSIGSDLIIDQTIIPTDHRIATVMHSPAEAIAAAGNWDGTVTLWRSSSGSQIGLFPLAAHDDAVTDGLFSADGRFLVTTSRDQRVHVWQFPELAPVISHSIHTDWVEAVAMSQDGTSIASAARDGQLILWDWETDAPQTLLSADNPALTDVAFAPVGSQFVVAGENGVTLWDAAIAHPLQTRFAEHEDSVIAVNFAPDGSIISGSVDGRLIVRDAVTQQSINPQNGSSADVFDWAISLDGQTAVAARDKTLTQYDTTTNTPVNAPITIGSSQITSVDLHINGQWVATGSVDGHVQVTNIETGAVLWQGQHEQQINDVTFSQDGEWLASASNDQTARIWVANTGSIVTEAFVHDTAVTRVMFTLQNQLVAGGEDGTITLWLTPEQSEIIGQHNGAITALAADVEEQYIASGSWDSTILLWDLAGTDDPPFKLNAHTRGIASLTFDAERQTLASGSWDDTVILWQLSSEVWQDAACEATTHTLTADELQQYQLDVGEVALCHPRDGVNANATR